MRRCSWRKNCKMHEGQRDLLKAMDTLADLEQYLGTEARAEYENFWRSKKRKKL